MRYVDAKNKHFKNLKKSGGFSKEKKKNKYKGWIIAGCVSVVFVDRKSVV